MRTAASASLSAGFWRTAALTMAWEALPVGVYGLFQGVALWGTLLTVVGLAALGVALSTPVIQWAQARRSSRPLATLLIVSFTASAIIEVWFAARPLPLYVGPKAAVLVHGLMLLALTALTAWRLMRSRYAK